MLYPEYLNEAFIEILISILSLVMALFVAMPFHEFAHAFMAKHEGDYTAVALKRYTLAPHAHFDLKGFIFLLLFRFGWAKPVPVDERNFKHGRRSKFLVAIAGIVMNLILGVLFLFIYFLIYKISPEFYGMSFYGKLLETYLITSVSLNFSLAFFNILPIYPLDGYRIIESFSKYETPALSFLKRNSMIIYLIFIFTGLYYICYSYVVGGLINLLQQLFYTILRL